MPPREAALKGSREIGFTVLSISISLVAVFIPLLLMGGIVGRLFREFSITVTAAIAVSALVSLILTPMLCARFLHHESGQHGLVWRAIEAVFDGMLSFYRRTLDVVLRHPFITLMVFFATMAASVYLYIAIPKGFFPIQDTGLITGFAEAGQDISPQEMARLMVRLGDVVAKDPDIAAVGRHDGQHGQRPDRQHGPLLHGPQAARSAQHRRDRHHRPAAAAARPRRGRQAHASAVAGHHRRRAHRPRPVPVHAAGRRYRRAQRMGAENPRQAPDSPRARRRLDRPAGQRAAADGQHQPRPGGALRHHAGSDRRHAERCLRPAPGGAVLHPDQHLSRHPRSAAFRCRAIRTRSTASISSRR